MPNWLVALLVYASPLLVILLFYFSKRRKQHKQSHSLFEDAVSDGLTEASSLHPVIDHSLCIGCGSCVTACPENNVLGLIHRKAQLVTPSNCIGHGACKSACPQEAIKLVFGSATRGVEIPDVSPNYETCVSGIYIAGELGGMGLIRNAIEQGRQALDSIADYIASEKVTDKKVLDCLIVGAGPAGLTASLGAKKHGLNTITIDQDSVGGTISHFPKGKLVMTQAATVPLVGKVKFGEISKEKLMKFWLETINKYQINIQQNERLVSALQCDDQTIEVITSKTKYKAKTLLLTIGRRGTPRQLGVTGEDSTKVVYRLVDPEQYAGKDVLVVGGGDSAIEAACSIAELNQNESKVSLSYRKDSFSRAKAKNRERVALLEKSGQLKTLMCSNVKSIQSDIVILDQNDKQIEINNEAVIVCAGGILPTKLLKDIGVETQIKYGTE